MNRTPRIRCCVALNPRRWYTILALLSYLFLVPALKAQELAEERIDEAVRRGLEYLLHLQRIDGSWNNYSAGNNIGQTALSALALKKSGLPNDHPALLKALNFLKYKTAHRTYDVSVILVLLEALGGETCKDWIEPYGEKLLLTQRARLWAYPSGALDMSNTQYAALGLNAAAKCGFKTGQKVWSDLLEGVIDAQHPDGGWAYRIGGKPTGSMTCAGLTCLLVCRERLQDVPRMRKGLERLEESMEKGFIWLSEYFLPDHNPRPHEKSHDDAWTHYYLYGIERVGGLSGRQHFGEHDWYQEGGRWLLDKQGTQGAWANPWGRKTVNTSFSLLFLTRATLGGRTRSHQRSRILSSKIKQDKKAEIVIGCNHENPGYLWIDSWSEKVADKYGVEGGDRIIQVERASYYCDGELLGEVREETGAGRVTRFVLPYTFKDNGVREIHAKVTCSSTHGTIHETFESNKLSLYVHNNMSEAELIAMSDVGGNLLRGRRIEVATSSIWDGHWNGRRAVDGFQGTGWLSAKPEADGAPWIKLVLDKAIRANLLKLTHVSAHHFDLERYGRAVKVRVLINRGAQKFIAELSPEETVKHALPFKTTRVKEIRIEMLDRVKGHTHLAAGFSEIEIFYEPKR
jgi:hypothetical protein